MNYKRKSLEQESLRGGWCHKLFIYICLVVLVYKPEIKSNENKKKNK